MTRRARFVAGTTLLAVLTGCPAASSAPPAPRPAAAAASTSAPRPPAPAPSAPPESTEPAVPLAAALAHDGDGGTLALVADVPAGWHIGWTNPGDSGLATALALELPAGVVAGPLEPPAPEVFADGDLVNFGHAGRTAFVVRLRGTLAGEAAATLRWVACREICVPGTSSATLPLEAPRAPDVARAAAAALPRPPTPADLVAVTRRGPDLRVSVASADSARLVPDPALEAALGGVRPVFAPTPTHGGARALDLRAMLGPSAGPLRGILLLERAGAVTALLLVVPEAP